MQYEGRLIIKEWEEKVILTFVFLLPFVRCYSVPVFGAKIQPSEFVFLAMIPLLIRSVPMIWYRFPRMGLGLLLLFVAVNLISAVTAGQVNGLLEGIGRIYLVSIFFIGWIYLNQAGQQGLHKVLLAWLWGGMTMAVISIVGYIVGLSGILNETVALYESYPYLGTMLRASGLTGGPGMLIIVLMPPLLFSWYQWRSGKKLWLFLLLFSISLLTFSKEIILISVALFWISDRERFKPMLVGATVAIALIYSLGTHFMVTREGGVNNDLENTHFTSNAVLFHVGDYRILETSYLTLKRTGLHVGSQNVWFGVGPGNFQSKVAALQVAGLYPAHLPAYEPHSTWTGGFAELGLIGLFAISMFVLWLFLSIYRVRNKLGNWHESRILLIYIVIILVISISMDVLNFRHLWLPLGMLVGLAGKMDDRKVHV